MCKKNEPLFACLVIYTHFGCLSLELNRVPGVLLEPYMSQGGQGSTELPVVLKGLMLMSTGGGGGLTCYIVLPGSIPLGNFSI